MNSNKLTSAGLSGGAQPGVEKTAASDVCKAVLPSASAPITGTEAVLSDGPTRRSAGPCGEARESAQAPQKVAAPAALQKEVPAGGGDPAQKDMPGGADNPAQLSANPASGLCIPQGNGSARADAPKRKRGRPRKIKTQDPAGAAQNTVSAQDAPTALKRAKTRKTTSKTACAPEEELAYRSEFCARLLAFFDVPPFKVTEVMKKDGSVTLVESASELPTFAAFARSLGVTQSRLMKWEEEHAAFAEAAKKARDLQGDILIQNSLRGNYSSSFAVFTAKNILGWSDVKEETKKTDRPLIIKWEK